MMAVLGLDLPLFRANDDGSVGAEIDRGTESVVVGETFFVGVTVEDQVDTDYDPADTSEGVTAIPLDLFWNPERATDSSFAVLEYADAAPPLAPGLIPLENLLVSPSFPLQRSVDQFDSLEGAENLRGGAVPVSGSGSALGAGGPEVFSLLRFTAVGAARAMPFAVELAGSMSFTDADPLTNDALPVIVRSPIRVQAVAGGQTTQDPGGGGLPGWEIHAYRDSNGDGRIQQAEFDSGPVDSETTDADGRYQLALDTGDPTDANPSGTEAEYVVVEVLRSGWEQVVPTTGNVWDQVDTGALVFGTAGHAVTISPGRANDFRELDFANLQETPETPETGGLSGFVYADTNADGVRDVDENGLPIELGLPNITIGLYASDAPEQPLEQAVTGPGGHYLFEGLEPGTYELRQEAQPVCFHDAAETLGRVWTGTEWQPRGTAAEDAFLAIELAAGEYGIDYNFGELGFKAEFINKRMLLTSLPSPKEPVAEYLGVTPRTVVGTDGDDTIEFTANLAAAEPEVAVTVNGETQAFPLAETDLLIVDAGRGNDEVTFTLVGVDEHIDMQPGYATLHREVVDGILRDWDYGVEVFGAEHVAATKAHATAGNRVVIRDTPDDDSLSASAGTIGLATAGGSRSASVSQFLGLDRVLAISNSGGGDSAPQSPPIDFLLEQFGNWRFD